jgi:hypothetical protein
MQDSSFKQPLDLPKSAIAQHGNQHIWRLVSILVLTGILSIATVPAWWMSAIASELPAAPVLHDPGQETDPQTRPFELKPAQIPLTELPPVLQKGVVFRAIAQGGLAGRAEQTLLMSDGRIMRARMHRDGTTSTLEPIRRISPEQLRQFRQLLDRYSFKPFHRLDYPAIPGSADFISLTLSSRSGTVRYADSVQHHLPRSLQVVIQAWSAISRP